MLVVLLFILNLLLAFWAASDLGRTGRGSPLALGVALFFLGIPGFLFYLAIREFLHEVDEHSGRLHHLGRGDTL